MTLLELAQRVAEFTQSGTINSLFETRESERIAHIIQETYNTMVLRKELPLKYKVTQLLSDPGDGLTHPASLKFTEELLEITAFKYERDDQYSELYYVPPNEFILNSFTVNHSDDAFVQLCKTQKEGIEYFVRTDKDPMYYTIFAGREIVVDSFNSVYEDSIQGVHTLVSATILPQVLLEDDFDLGLDKAEEHSLLLNARTAANLELNNEVNQIDALEARKAFNLLDGRNSKRKTSLWESQRKLGRR